MCSVQACGVQHLMRAVLAVFSCTALFAWGCTALGYDGRCVGPRSQHRHLTVSGHLPYDSTVRDSTNPGDFFGTVQVQLQERSEEHTSELQSLRHLVCRLLLEKKK